MAPLVYFKLERLKVATDNFDEKRLLGTGGFAKVYLGVETGPDGTSQQFAVKVATRKAEPKAFQREITRVSAFPNPNLVRLIGYCHDKKSSKEKVEEREQILIYQYAVHGSLHDNLADEAKRRLLSLDARIRIAEGTARAIAFLHENHLIHHDIKMHNILLDENWKALLADFGALQLLLPEFSTIAERREILVSKGYTEPEYWNNGSLKPDCDVYSFGVVLLQLASGESADLKEGKCRLPLSTGEKSLFLAAWARGREHNWNVELLRDPGLIGASESSLRKLIELGLRCVRLDRAQRPDIFQVLKDLEDMTRNESGMAKTSSHVPTDGGLYAASVIETNEEERRQAAGRNGAAATTSESLQGNTALIMQQVGTAEADFWTRTEKQRPDISEVLIDLESMRRPASASAQTSPDVPKDRGLHPDIDIGANLEDSVLAQEVDAAAASTSESLRGDFRTRPSTTAREFTPSELATATDDFDKSRIVGSWRLGTVYKGFLSIPEDGNGGVGGEACVAVKLLNLKTAFRVKKEEIQRWGGLYHPQLEGLLGFGITKGGTTALVHELLPNGSLHSHLNGGNSVLTYAQRMSIALDAAKGLEHLHHHDITHGDPISSNIVLHMDLRAKLSDYISFQDVDFGPRGTPGYMAMEYAQTGWPTAASDVYTFGVVLLELLSGCRVYDLGRPLARHILILGKLTSTGAPHDLGSLLDSRLKEYSHDGARRVADLARRCCQEDAKLRPSMSEVVPDLEGVQATAGRPVAEGHSPGPALLQGAHVEEARKKLKFSRSGVLEKATRSTFEFHSEIDIQQQPHASGSPAAESGLDPLTRAPEAGTGSEDYGSVAAAGPLQEAGEATQKQRHPDAAEIRVEFTGAELTVITRLRSTMLGEGRFGPLYLGVLASQQRVAVRFLNRETVEGFLHWPEDVGRLSRLDHANLVSMVGFSSKGGIGALVYEHVPNPSLADHLYKEKGLPLLAWNQRVRIACGAARGLAYLHEKSVQFGDLRASNILLTEDFEAKLSDFGLAREETDQTTQVRGDERRPPSRPTLEGEDVSKFGVVLLELLAGRAALDPSRLPGERNLVEWARPYLDSGDGVRELADPRMEFYKVEEAEELARVISRCLRDKADERPPMADVARSLMALNAAAAAAQPASLPQQQWTGTAERPAAEVTSRQAASRDAGPDRAAEPHAGPFKRSLASDSGDGSHSEGAADHGSSPGSEVPDEGEGAAHFSRGVSLANTVLIPPFGEQGTKPGSPAPSKPSAGSGEDPGVGRALPRPNLRQPPTAASQELSPPGSRPQRPDIFQVLKERRTGDMERMRRDMERMGGEVERMRRKSRRYESVAATASMSAVAPTSGATRDNSDIGWDTEDSMQAAQWDGAEAAPTSASLQGDLTTIMQRVRVAETDVWTRKPRPSPVSTPTTGACFRDLTGHTSWVTALTVSESNIFSGAADRTIKMWNMDTGRCVGTIPGGTRSPFRPRSETGHTDHVTALCCGPDRVLYSASTDKTIKAWKGGKWLATLKGHDGSVLALTVTSDNVLFSGGKDMVIRRWDNMRPGGDLRGHAEPVTALAIAPNGRLWSGDAGSNVKGWQDGEPFIKFRTLQGSISGLAFDGNDTLWTASSDNVTVEGWKGKRCVAVIDAHMDVVTALAVAPDGTVWTGSRDKTVRGHRWDGVAPPMCVVTYEGHKGDVTALAVGHDGTVWSGGRDKLIMGWRPLGQGVPPSSGAP